MYQTFTPPSLYRNYQPPPQGSDLFAPVPGWGWPASSAGPRNVGVGGLGADYAVHLPIIGDTTVSIPMDKMGQDVVSAIVPALQVRIPDLAMTLGTAVQQQMPLIIGKARKDLMLTVVEGAVLAGLIGATGILGYKYFIEKKS